MPSYKFEAMDTSGEEVKDEIEATNEEEAQQKIKQMGYFVTKLTAVGGGKQKSQTLKRKVIGAMVYPAVVICAAIGILIFIMVAIIPKFEKIFREFGLKLPALTQFLIDVSMWCSKYWWSLPLVPLGIWLLFKLIRLSRAGNYALDRMTLWIPVIGKIVEKTVVARTMRT